MLQFKPEILFFESEIKNLIWGNEYWTISAHDHGDVKVKKGHYTGMTLSQLWAEHPELFGMSEISEEGSPSCSVSFSFPLLAKIITANDDLSIQVHPDDDYANLNENGSLGKTECWYILDCDENAHLVLGHNAKNQTELKKLVDNGHFTELIREVSVRKGDFVQINPGTIHSINGGIRLLEIQQSSDITYRLYDYGRTINGKPRPLHLRQAIDVIECPAADISEQIITDRKMTDNRLNKLISCDYYTVWELPVRGDCLLNQEYPFLIVCVIAGEGQVDDERVCEGDHFILPYRYGEAKFNGKMQLILAIPVKVSHYE